MAFLLESENMADYLKNSEHLIDFNHPAVQAKIHELKAQTNGMEELARTAFYFVRDHVQHSFDTGSPVITVSASDALLGGEGICFAKTHLLAALLRGADIPTGFCYQRVTRKGTIESGHALHGLNAVYLSEETGWFRIDPRGNKEGVESEFSIGEEKLAYPIREELGEIDYPHIFTVPIDSVLRSMRDAGDCHELFFKRPEELTI